MKSKGAVRSPANARKQAAIRNKGFGLWKRDPGNTVVDGLSYEREIRQEWDGRPFALPDAPK